MQSLALPWLVYRLTGSALLLGTVSFASQIPSLFIAPVAGVLTDRYDKHKLLIATQALSMLQAFALTYFYFFGDIGVTHIVILGVFLGIVNAFDIPVRQAFVIEMVENKEDLSNAIALNSSIFNGARLLGPSVAGIIIALTNEGICFLLNGISYVFVIASLLMMTVTRHEIKPKVTHIIHELKEGVLYAFGFFPLKAVLLLLTLVCLMGLPYSVLMPVFVKEILHGDSDVFGFLMGATGFGAFAGTMYLASRRTVVGLGKIIGISALFFGIGLIAFAFSREFWLSMFFMLITGFGMIMQIAATNTIMQTIVDDDKRGRVMSFYTTAIIGISPFGSLLIGHLASEYGAPNALIVGGVSVIIGASVYLSKLPKMRKYLYPIYIRLGIMTERNPNVIKMPPITVPPAE